MRLWESKTGDCLLCLALAVVCAQSYAQEWLDEEWRRPKQWREPMWTPLIVKQVSTMPAEDFRMRINRLSLQQMERLHQANLEGPNFQNMSHVGAPTAMKELTSELEVCPGEVRYWDGKCQHHKDIRICAQLLEPGGGRPRLWGVTDYWQAGLEEKMPFMADEILCMRKTNSDSWCIDMWDLAFMIPLVGCANVHIRCEASDMDYVFEEMELRASMGGTTRQQNTVALVNHLPDAIECLKEICSVEGGVSKRKWMPPFGSVSTINKSWKATSGPGRLKPPPLRKDRQWPGSLINDPRSKDERWRAGPVASLPGGEHDDRLQGRLPGEHGRAVWLGSRIFGRGSFRFSATTSFSVKSRFLVAATVLFAGSGIAFAVLRAFWFFREPACTEPLLTT